MKSKLLPYVDIRNSVTIRQTKRVFFGDVIRNSLQPAPGGRIISRIDERHTPWFRVSVMDLHFVFLHVEPNISHLQKVIGKIFLDQIALIAAAHNELLKAI